MLYFTRICFLICKTGVGSSFGFTIPFTVVDGRPRKSISPATSSFHGLSLPSLRKRGSFKIHSLSARMLPGWKSASQGQDDHIDTDGQHFSSNTSVEGHATTMEVGLTPSRSRVSEVSLSAIDLTPPENGVFVNGSSFAQCGLSSFSQSQGSYAADRRGNLSDTLSAAIGRSLIRDYATGGNTSASNADLCAVNGGASSQQYCNTHPSISRRDTSNTQIGSSFTEGPNHPLHDRGLSPQDMGPSLYDRGLSPQDMGPSPFDRGLFPQDMGPSLYDRGLSPQDMSPSFYDRGLSPLDCNSPLDRGLVFLLVDGKPGDDCCVGPYLQIVF